MSDANYRGSPPNFTINAELTSGQWFVNMSPARSPRCPEPVEGSKSEIKQAAPFGGLPLGQSRRRGAAVG